MDNCYNCEIHDICMRWRKPALYGVKKELGCDKHFKRSVDAVVVVRCKDCKHRRNHSCYREVDRIEALMAEKGVIFINNAPTYYIRNHDDFCSYGERRTDERKAD